ncbi:OmpA family protein [uncultured Paracoccus sp.]|uniref:OmpA family protein n=1 Tax=uncultured Paracoccus sp. TaxID=189685 RepID=UPI0025D4B9D2|nr:OmpA family protein [uncultured Paracoccus sp.]
MNRMFKTTTAIVASLSLLAPGLAVAQDAATEAETTLPDQIIPPQEGAEPEAVPLADEAEAPETDPVELAPAEESPMQPETLDAAPEAETLPGSDAVDAPAEPAQDADMPQSDTPAEALPAEAVEDSPAEALETPVDPQPETEGTDPTAPPESDTLVETPPAEAPAEAPAETTEAPAAEETDADALRRALQEQEDAAAGTETTAEEADLPEDSSPADAAEPQDDPAADEALEPATGDAPLAEDAAPADEAGQDDSTADEVQDPAGLDVTPPLDSDEAVTPDTDLEDAAQDGAEAAPEADAAETDLSREAANPAAPAENEALKALLESDASGGERAAAEVSDVEVTAEDLRSSDEDFLTSVVESVTGTQEAGDSSRNRDRDIARMALAGMAGFAVGNMLSNNREVALNTGDRVVVTLPDGSQQLIKDDNALLLRPGSNVQTERYADGSTITTVLRDDGSRVVTIRDAEMNVLRRTVQWPDGRSTMLIDETAVVEPVRISELPPPARPIDYTDRMDENALREALMRESNADRRFSLSQIRNIAQVRALVAPLDIQSITFDTGSAAISPTQAEQLSLLGRVIADSIRDNPNEVFLIEGHTDAVGSDISNLALSDRRAESVALALTEYFDVPPENLVVQGYGEQFLRIETQEAERANRRVGIRRITELIAQ